MNIRSVIVLAAWIVCTLYAPGLRAAVFTVTSNASAGAGTLRDAILKANANGTAETDYIYFNLPGSTLVDVTVTINKDALPEISSNVIIDGSTQPSAPFSPNGARVAVHVLVASGFTNYYVFHIKKAENVAIYGLMLSINSGYGSDILLTEADGVTIGGPGKGNVLLSVRDGYGIGSRGVARSSNLTIQSNIIGLDKTGTTYVEALSAWEGIRVPVTNVLIGGDTPEEGNVIYAISQGIVLLNLSGTVRIAHNKVGTDITGTRFFHASQLAKVELWGDVGAPPGEVLVTDNLISGESWWGLKLARLQNGFKVLRNKIGVDITGQLALGASNAALVVHECKTGLIGGSEADANYIAGGEYGVQSGSTYRVTISKNKMFCNRTNGIGLSRPTGSKPAPDITITACDGNSMSGHTIPNATVEVFRPHQCDRFGVCDGKDYIETIYADAAGNFTYPLNGLSGAVFTATDEDGTTGPYTGAWVNASPGDIVHTTCGGSTGKVIVRQITGAIKFHWEDEAGNIVGRDTSLINVPAGKYRLALFPAGCKTGDCITTTRYMEVTDVSPTIDKTAVNIQNATCGRRNGFIINIGYTGKNQHISWKNEAGTEVSTYGDLYNVPPGRYYVTLTDAVGLCAVTEGPFTVGNTEGPVLDLSAAVLTMANCARPTGAITGVKVSGTGAISYTWKNEQGQPVGTSADVSGLAPGKYYLYYADQSACGETKSDAFEIRAPGVIAIDKSGVSITPSGCNVSSGSIAGLAITGGDTWQWTNADGPVSGTATGISLAAAGNYTLTVSNATGCKATETFTIPQAKPNPVTAQLAVRHPSCQLPNGSIAVSSTSGGAPVTFTWHDDGGQTISNEKDLRNVKEGTYQLYITDQLHCTHLAATAALQNIPPPVIDAANASTGNDACNTGQGFIRGLRATGSAPLRYEWATGNTIVAATLAAEALRAGEYTLTVTDVNGCATHSNPFAVYNTNTGLPAPLLRDVQIVRGMTAAIRVSQPESNTTYHLYYAATNAPAASNTTGAFSLPGLTETTGFYAVKQTGDCFSSPAPVKVEVVDGIRVTGPNAFSPNGDGKNDVFRVKAFGLAALDLFTVHDRWGNRVFVTKDIHAVWDGTVNGRKVPAGTYVWSVTGKDILGEAVQQQGFVVVVY